MLSEILDIKNMIDKIKKSKILDKLETINVEEYKTKINNLINDVSLKVNNIENDVKSLHEKIDILLDKENKNE